jgi:hypothetical protein
VIADYEAARCWYTVSDLPCRSTISERDRPLAKCSYGFVVRPPAVTPSWGVITDLQDQGVPGNINGVSPPDHERGVGIADGAEEHAVHFGN